MIALIKHSVKKLLLAVVTTVLIGCAATQTALEHGSLQVSTKQKGDSIFLSPVRDAQKTVYVSVKNASDEDINIAPRLKSSLMAQGYKVLTNPDAAHYLLQVNVLKVGTMSKTASHSALGGGYGSALAGAATGAATKVSCSRVALTFEWPGAPWCHPHRRPSVPRGRGFRPKPAPNALGRPWK